MDLVVGIDSSTTATKAIAFNRDGGAVAEGRAPVPMSRPRPGWFEQEPDDWWASLQGALRDLIRQVDPARVAALAIANQRETVGFLDADGRSLRPGFVWLDERGAEEIGQMSAEFGADRLLRITGKVPNATAALYRLRWLLNHEPETLRRAAHIVDVHGCLVWRLTGLRVTSWGSADPHAIFDLGRMEHSREVIEAAGARVDQFFPAVRPGSVIGALTETAAAATGLPVGTVVVAGGGDGQAAGLGTATLGDGVAYFNLGTASVSGVWSRDYVTDRPFRTLTSLTGEGYILELCLRTGSFLTDWTVQSLFGADPAAEPGVYDRLEALAAKAPVGSGGLLLLPYWSGVMAPFWDTDARGTIVGLGPGHGQAHVYRAMMEGIALDEAMGLDAIERVTGEKVRAITMIGGGARSPLWRQIVADATQRPVHVSETVEASCLGAGMLAAVGAGWYADTASAARAMCGTAKLTVMPDAERAAVYRELLAAYAELYPALRTTFARLARFALQE